MLQKLKRYLDDLPIPADGVANSVTIAQARVLLSRRPVYAQAVAQLSSDDVDGCFKDAVKALQLKAVGNNSYAAGDFEHAAAQYSEALKWLPLSQQQQQQEAARIHSNRASALIKLATAAAEACTCSMCRSSSSSTCRNGSSSSSTCRNGSSSSSCRRTEVVNCQTTVLAAAAVDDCTATLLYCPADPSLRSKVLFRRATARLLLQQNAAAADDCEAAAAAAEQVGDVRSTADVTALLHRLQAAAAAGDIGGDTAQQLSAREEQNIPQQQQQQQQQRLHLQQQQQVEQANCCSQTAAAAAAAAAARFDEGWQQEQQQEPPCGPQLLELQQLLQQAALNAEHWWQQQQQQRQQQQQQQQHGLRCSQLLRCCYSAAAGRHVVAAADIQPGTLLLLEQPLAAVPVSKSKTSNDRNNIQNNNVRPGGGMCGWCFGPLGLAPWPCTHCPLVLYCSLACRTAGSTTAAGHIPGGIECGKPWIRLLPEDARLASRCVAAAAAAAAAGVSDAGACTAARDAAVGDTQVQQQQQQYATRGLADFEVQRLTVQLFASLQQHVWSDNRQSDANTLHEVPSGSSSSNSSRVGQWKEQLLLSLLLSDIIAASGQGAQNSSRHNGSSSNSGGSSSSGSSNSGGSSSSNAPSPAALFKCLGQLVTNGIAIRPLLTSSAADRLGLGLYPVTAMLNHSCDPNCSIRFVGRQLLLVCVRRARMGEQLTLSYGPQLGQQPTAVRQLQLQEQYNFCCSCSSCSHGLGHVGSSSSSGGCVGSSSSSSSSMTAVQQQEAAAAGLRCCTAASSCGGAVLPNVELPAGIVAQYPVKLNSSSCSSWCCTTCAWQMPPSHQQQQLKQLQHAAAAAEAAAATMTEAGQLQQTATTGAAARSTHQQQQQLVRQSLQLLQQAAAVRQSILHPCNQLLGSSHHRAAAAAIAAAVLLHEMQEMQPPSPAAAAAVGQETPLLAPLKMLQSSINATSADEICGLIQQLQIILPGSENTCTCSSCTARHTADDIAQCTAECTAECTALQLQQQCAVGKMAHVAAVVAHSTHSNAALTKPTTAAAAAAVRVMQSEELEATLNAPCSCTTHRLKANSGNSSSSTPQQTCRQQQQQQDMLRLALLHFGHSLRIAAYHLPADALGIAAEQLIAAAAVAALLEPSCKPQQQQQQQQGGAVTAAVVAEPRQWCCRCSRLWLLARNWLANAEHIVGLHLGSMM